MIDDIYINTSVTTIITLHLHCVYFRHAEGPGGGTKAWITLGSTIRLAQTVRPSILSLFVVLMTTVDRPTVSTSTSYSFRSHSPAIVETLQHGTSPRKKPINEGRRW
jgi:hypothetical protein